MGVYRFSLPVRLSLLHIRHIAQSESTSFWLVTCTKRPLSHSRFLTLDILPRNADDIKTHGY